MFFISFIHFLLIYIFCFVFQVNFKSITRQIVKTLIMKMGDNLIWIIIRLKKVEELSRNTKLDCFNLLKKILAEMIDSTFFVFVICNSGKIYEKNSSKLELEMLEILNTNKQMGKKSPLSIVERYSVSVNGKSLRFFENCVTGKTYEEDFLNGKSEMYAKICTFKLKMLYTIFQVWKKSPIGILEYDWASLKQLLNVVPTLNSCVNDAHFEKKLTSYKRFMLIFEAAEKDINLKSLELKHHLSMKVQYNIAREFFMGLYSVALRRLIELEKLQSKVLGDSRYLYLATQHSIACCEIHLELYSAALNRLMKTKVLMKITLGERHSITLAALRNIGDCMTQMGLFTQAIKILTKNVNHQKESFGDHHPSTLEAQSSLAQCEYEMGYFNAAKIRLKTVKKIQVKTLGEKSLLTLTTAHRIAKCDIEMGLFSEAIKQLLDIQIKLPRNDNTTCIEIQHSIAKCELGMGFFSSAKKRLENIEKRIKKVSK